MEKPYELLDEIKGYNIEYIIIDRTPFFLSEDDDRLTVQNVPPTIYKASYPAWFFNQKKMIAHLNDKYRLVAEFDALAGEISLSSPFASAKDKGFILRRKS